MSKLTTKTLKTSNKVLYQLRKAGSEGWKVREEGVVVIKERSNKGMDCRFKTGSRKVTTKMPEGCKEKHRSPAHNSDVIFKRESY